MYNIEAASNCYYIYGCALSLKEIDAYIYFPLFRFLLYAPLYILLLFTVGGNSTYAGNPQADQWVVGG